MAKGRALKEEMSNKVHKVMSEFKHKSLKSGSSGKKVTNRKQAIAIAMNSERKEK